MTPQEKAQITRVQQNQLTLVGRSLSSAHMELGNYASLCEPGAEADEANNLKSELAAMFAKVKALKDRADPNVVRNPLTPKGPV